MSDDLNKKIKQITDLLGQENMPDNLKGLLNMLTSPGTRDDSPSSKDRPAHEEAPRAAREDRVPKNELEENIEMVRKIKKVMDRVNTNNDPRVNLLTAIRPFLSNTRQQKLGTCIKLLQVSSMARFIDDFDKDSF